ncbi:hypothetical protein ACS0TY_005099 [Phlomoides rotata]
MASAKAKDSRYNNMRRIAATSITMARICLLIVLVLVQTILTIQSLQNPLLQVIARDPVQLKLDNKILQESVVKLINNNAHSGWKASMNPRFANYTVGQFMHLLGVKPLPEGHLKGIPVVTHEKGLELPTNFDARTTWPQCSTIGDILEGYANCFDFFSFSIRFKSIKLSQNKDQGHCGSCWAFAAVEALSDRFCIHFGTNISLSVNDLLACCGFMCGDGCDGGYPISAWRYFVHTGVVTAECDPYFDKSGCSHPGCEPAYPTPKCEKKCQKQNLLWKDSKHFSLNAYRTSSDPYSIMAEVYKNGPVEVAFTVYEVNKVT